MTALGSRFDQWLTTDPAGDMPSAVPQPKCNVCGRFVPDVALHHITVDEVEMCDGGDGDHWALCGQATAHEPHEVIMGGYTVIYRQCSGGHVAKEFVI